MIRERERKGGGGGERERGEEEEEVDEVLLTSGQLSRANDRRYVYVAQRPVGFQTCGFTTRCSL